MPDDKRIRPGVEPPRGYWPPRSQVDLAEAAAREGLTPEIPATGAKDLLLGLLGEYAPELLAALPVGAAAFKSRGALPRFVRGFRTAIEELAESKNLPAEKLSGLDLAQIYLGLRTPTAARRYGTLEATYDARYPGIRGYANAIGREANPQIGINPVNVPPRGMFAPGETVETLGHETGHVGDRLRSLLTATDPRTGKTKRVGRLVPEQTSLFGKLDPVTGRPGQFKTWGEGPSGTLDRAEYRAQPAEASAIRWGQAAERDYHRFIAALRREKTRLQGLASSGIAVDDDLENINRTIQYLGLLP